MQMARLVVGGEPVALLRIATTRRERRHGLLGVDAVVGALLLPGVRSVHTVGMRVPIDVGYGTWRSSSMAVPSAALINDVVAMPRFRVGRPRRCDFVLEAALGALHRWGIGAGTTIEIVVGAEPT